jgi:hypothetical protein
MITNDEIARRRRGGIRLLGAGAAFLAAGLVILVIADQRTGGGVTHPEISDAGRGLSFLAGLPATIGYVLGALGFYRLLEGRGDSRKTVVVVGRAVFGILAAAVFFVGAFWIVMAVRDPSVPVPRSPTP